MLNLTGSYDNTGQATTTDDVNEHDGTNATHANGAILTHGRSW